ncbi:DNA-binding response regulator [Niabella sp.]|uniref:response regulator transcription factor n=1 Tax=Niabella sp. TaxID=1962976 RepID=UPI0026044C50|nr:DNA-binding response regulator [Niabella sp.]
MRKECILMVSGKESVLTYLSAYFEPKYTVLATSGGAAALQLLQGMDISLIISDGNLREMDGHAFCKILKSDPDHACIPFILLGSPRQLQDKVMALEYGADVYMEKPVSMLCLDAQVTSLLANRARLKKYFEQQRFQKSRPEEPRPVRKGFLERLEELIEYHISDPSLSVKFLAEKMHMSRPLFYRKAKILCAQTPYKMIDEARLKKAASLITEGKHKLSDISAAVGFNSPAQFSKNFKKQFGIAPSSYA